MTFRRTVLWLCLLLCLVGAGCLYGAWRTAVWTDNEKAFALENSYPPEATSADPDAYKSFNRRWHSEMDALRTTHYPLYDFGTGSIALAATLALGMFALGIRTMADVLALRTPRRRVYILLLAVLAWCAFWSGAIVSAVSDVHRFEVPPWADTLAIPIFAATSVCVVLGPVFLAILWLAGLWRSRLPVSLWISPQSRPWLLPIWTAVTALALAGCAYLFVSVMTSGPFVDIPVILLLAYLVLAVRASALSRAA